MYLFRHNQRSQSRNVCLVRHDYHPGDSRIENQAQALRESGFKVDVLCMQRGNQSMREMSNGIQIFRVPALNRSRGGLIVYMAEYLSFWIAIFFTLSYLHLRRQYLLIQVCNLPDFLVFAALVPKLMGSKILFDFRECMPEMYAAKFNLSMDSQPVQMIGKLEQACVRFADRAVTCTEQMRQATIRRGTPANKIFVMMNSVDPAKFHDPNFPNPNEPIGRSFNIVTHGSIIPRYGHETLLRAMAIVKHKAPESRLTILGRGQHLSQIRNLVRDLELEEVVHVKGFVPFSELIQTLRSAHIGAVTMTRNPETDLIHTLKMQEYMVLGIPIVISRTSAVEGYFDESQVQFFTSQNVDDLASAILLLRNNAKLRYQLAINAYQQCRLYNTQDQKQRFARQVQTMIDSAEHQPKLRIFRRVTKP